MDQLLEWLISAVAQRYSGDPTTAGVVIAHTPQGYYISICRYHERYGRTREIVERVHGSNLYTALEEIILKWANRYHDIRAAENVIKNARYQRPSWGLDRGLIDQMIGVITPPAVKSAPVPVPKKPDPPKESKKEEFPKDRFLIIEID